MRNELDVRARLQSREAELSSLQTTIRELRYQVKDGGSEWRAALDALATADQRRRFLESERLSLQWVLAQEVEYAAGAQRSA